MANSKKVSDLNVRKNSSDAIPLPCSESKPHEFSKNLLTEFEKDESLEPNSTFPQKDSNTTETKVKDKDTRTAKGEDDREAYKGR